ncbi:MAG TPA: DNA topoisomerase VI subunit B [Candidatus Methanomethylia archaeon]|nr:DNA topoisomerase VI subunit B [Candidatus Methanomethylicia archaeon]
MEQPETFRALGVAEFFYRNRAIAGFTNPTRSVYQTIRELVENALDATEMHGIPPDIRVIVKKLQSESDFDLLEITVEDNGIGIPPEHVPRAFCSVLYGSKYVNRQSRGVFGLGVKMAVLYSQLTTGRPVKVVTSPLGDPAVYEFEMTIDIKTNTPKVLKKSVSRSNNFQGTKVTLYIEGSWGSAKSRVVEYIKRTAIIAPYANIYFRYPEDDSYRILRFSRSTTELPPAPREVLPHPYGVDAERLKSMIEHEEPNKTLLRFITEHFAGVGRVTAAKFLRESGFGVRRTLRTLKDKDIVRLARAMKTWKWKRPGGEGLSPLGEEILKLGIQEVLKPEFIATTCRPPSSYEGYGFIVECGLAWGGAIQPAQTPSIIRFANRIPLLYDENIDVTRKVVDKIDWSTYKVAFPAPLVVVTHVCSTKLPFHGLGKEAIADIPELEHEIEMAVRDCARRLREHLSRIERETRHIRRLITIKKYIPIVASSLSSILETNSKDIEDSLFKMLEARRHGG